MENFHNNSISRKAFIQMASVGGAGILVDPHNFIRANLKIKAVAFDAFPIFDPGSIFKPIKELLPDRAIQIIELWQLKQFSYQWLRVSANQYKNFLEVAKDALDFALAQSKLRLSEKEKKLIIAGYDNMHAWPDVGPALQTIKREGLRICFLSNMTAQMLHKGIKNSNLSDVFDFVISTDEKQTFKPGRQAYQMAVEQLKVNKEEILFVPFAGWDLAGAKWFGYPTFWVNRLNSINERLDAEPDGSGSNLSDLVDFIKKYNHAD
jgi:2-haloacid dehalogenase